MNRFVLPLTTVKDSYSYFPCPGASFVTVQAFNNGIDIGYGLYENAAGGVGSGDYPSQDEYLALQSATLPRRCDEIRYKNHVAGQVAQVQITAQGSDDIPSGTPLAVGINSNFLTINPDGSVGATLTGIIKALGLTLPAGFGGATARNKVGWTRTKDGALVASVASWTSSVDGTGGTFTLLDSPGPDIANSDAQIFLTSNENTGVGNNFARVGVGTLAAILLDDIGRSNFAQLLTAQKVFITFGSVVITWPGGTPFSNTATTAVLFPTSTLSGIATGGDNVIAMIESFAGKALSVRGRTADGSSPGAGQQATIYFEAAGN